MTRNDRSEQVNIVERERHFHDEWAEAVDPQKVLVFQSFTASTAPENRWLRDQIGEIRGKRVLELGSGCGEGAVYFAYHGADVVATDVSPGMLEVVKKVAAMHGVTLQTVNSSAEDLAVFPPNSFDIVYAANLLHHVNVEDCLDEVQRVLKPGGIGAFWDPIAHNPIINIYRRMAIAVRTEDEHPLRRSQLRWFRKRFPVVQTKCFWFLALLVFVKYYMVDRIHPSSDRYWKRIITHEHEIEWLYRPLAAIDEILLQLVPILQWWCWNIAIIVRKV